MITRAPRRDSSRAVTSPMPEVAPVTRHVLPSIVPSRPWLAMKDSRGAAADPPRRLDPNSPSPPRQVLGRVGAALRPAPEVGDRPGVETRPLVRPLIGFG